MWYVIIPQIIDPEGSPILNGKVTDKKNTLQNYISSITLLNWIFLKET